MSKKKQKQEEKDYVDGVDKQIMQLATDLADKGIKDDQLIVAVAKIYGNSLLIAYKNSLSE